MPLKRNSGTGGALGAAVSWEAITGAGAGSGSGAGCDIAGPVDWATAAAFVASADSGTAAAAGVPGVAATGSVSFGDVPVSTPGVWLTAGVRRVAGVRA